MPVPSLSLLETRVLGTLYEKQHTVPDTYPLSLNALVAGCNQKSSRNPVMEASEPEVQAAVDSLKGANLVIESSGSRVTRYSHNLERVLQVPSQSAALLAVLMLRGPQTAGELRTRAGRMHPFDSLETTQNVIDSLIARDEPLAAKLPGSRADRYAQLLCPELNAIQERSGASAAPVAASAPRAASSSSSHVHADLEPRIAALEEEVARLRRDIEQITQALQVSPES